MRHREAVSAQGARERLRIAHQYDLYIGLVNSGRRHAPPSLPQETPDAQGYLNSHRNDQTYDAGGQ
ncbi:MAG: hypothetical protein ACAI44_23760 [Candidatus Sericytochromatia bacterium]